MDILTLTFFNNTILEYLMALGVVIGAVIAFKVLKFFVLTRLKTLAEKTSNDLDDFLIKSIDKINWPLFAVGVTYDTSVEKLRKIPEIITGIIEEIDDATPSRCHFKEYGDFSLNFETVFYIESADFTQHNGYLTGS